MGRTYPAFRWVILLFCFLATSINYLDRANLGIAAPFIQKEFGLGSATMGVLLSGFFWSYALMQLPCGWLIDRFGVRLSYSLAVGWWSLMTMGTALVSSAAGLFGLRLSLGIGESFTYPSNGKACTYWFPRGERAFASSVFDSGSRVGSALAIPFVTLAIAAFGWRGSFVISAIPGVLWAICWFVLYRDPDRHRFASPSQRAALRREIGHAEAQAAVPDGTTAIRWRDLFRYRAIWGMMLGFFCLNFAVYFFSTWFPTFLMQSRGFSLARLGTLGLLPSAVGVVGGWGGGLFSDSLVRRGWDVTRARKLCLGSGLVMASAMALTPLVRSDWGMLALLSFCNAALAFSGANIWTLPGHVAPTPDHVGSIGGIQNFAGNCAGIVLTTFTGLMLGLTHGSFTIPFITAGAACLLGAASYVLLVPRFEPLFGRYAGTWPH